MKFVKTDTDSQSSARCGVITTDHGTIETPIFMPVGTVGSVKGIYPMGAVTFIDNSPVLPSGDWLSVLREDKTVIFTPGDDTECTYRTYTSYFENAVEYEIMIYNYTTSETIQLDLLAPEGSASIAGTYTAPVNPEDPKAGEFIPGA